MEIKETKHTIEDRNDSANDAFEEASGFDKKLPMSKVFDLKVVPSTSEESPTSTHSFCTSCTRPS